MNIRNFLPIILISLSSCRSQYSPSYFDYIGNYGIKISEPSGNYVLLKLAQNKKTDRIYVTTSLPIYDRLRINPGDSINYAGCLRFDKDIISAVVYIDNISVWDWSSQLDNNKEIRFFFGSTIVPEQEGIYNLRFVIIFADESKEEYYREIEVKRENNVGS